MTKFLHAALLVVCASAVCPAAVARECTPPAVTIHQDDPTEAVLTWPKGAGAVEYFLQYSTGKTPTQVRVTAKPEDTLVSAELWNLRPGKTTTVEFCEGYAPGACPGRAGGDEISCTTLIEVSAALAAPGVEQADTDKAVCTLQSDVAWIGHLIGAEPESIAEASSAEACCQLCGWKPPNRPYVGQCTHFIFDPSAGRCYFYRDAEGTTPAAGATSGQVTAWPKPR